MQYFIIITHIQITTEFISYISNTMNQRKSLMALPKTVTKL